MIVDYNGSVKSKPLYADMMFENADRLMISVYMSPNCKNEADKSQGR